MTPAEIAQTRALVRHIHHLDKNAVNPSRGQWLELCDHLTRSLNQIEADAATIKELGAEVERLQDPEYWEVGSHDAKRSRKSYLSNLRYRIKQGLPLNKWERQAIEQEPTT